MNPSISKKKETKYADACMNEWTCACNVKADKRQVKDARCRVSSRPRGRSVTEEFQDVSRKGHRTLKQERVPVAASTKCHESHTRIPTIYVDRSYGVTRDSGWRRKGQRGREGNRGRERKYNLTSSTASTSLPFFALSLPLFAVSWNRSGVNFRLPRFRTHDINARTN